MFKRILKIAVLSLSNNKLRTILTTLGIVIGTAIVIIVLSELKNSDIISVVIL